MAAQRLPGSRGRPSHGGRPDDSQVGIPDHILLEPGRLTAEEWTHARLGSDAIEQAERDASRSVEFLVLAKEIAHYHHEKWNGSDYLDGLAADGIPISASLLVLAAGRRHGHRRMTGEPGDPS
jgi:hypothetical protein